MRTRRYYQLVTSLLVTCSLTIGAGTRAFGQAETALPENQAGASAAETAARRLPTTRQYNQQVLEALQQGDLQAALEAFGKVADLASSLPLTVEDGRGEAAAAIHRTLAERSTDEQYEWLRSWTLPSEDRNSVRILTVPVPHQAPPKQFARLLGQRPRDSSFPVADIQGVPGLFSTAWALVRTADDAGHLRRLTAELEELSEQKIPNADLLLLLARLAARSADLDPIRQELQQRATRVAAAEPNDLRTLQEMDEHLLLAAASLKHAALRDASEQLLHRLTDRATEFPTLLPVVRLAHAVAVQTHRGTSGPAILHTNPLQHWIPVATDQASSLAASMKPVWLVHEEHVLHLTGSRSDLLLFRYPVEGEFAFHCDTQNGGDAGTDGGLFYGGLRYGTHRAHLQVTDADTDWRLERSCPYVLVVNQHPVFNHVSLHRNDEGVATFAANRHPMWRDAAAASSPWLGLHSWGQNRPVFRNLAFEGSPRIPRAVQLASGPHLRGWQAGFYGETLAAFDAEAQPIEDPATGTVPNTDESPNQDPDWTLEEGNLSAVAAEAADGEPSLLRYVRPLLGGESLQYEFFYTPGEVEVHPAVGRLAFLVEAEGVRIRWLTNGKLDWTGLAADNATLEPLNRRGPRTLPLNAGQWNRMTVARAEGKVSLTLNDTLIYERPLDDLSDTCFGLYRERRHAVQVRSVVLAGDWPETIPQDLLEQDSSGNGSDSQQTARPTPELDDAVAQNVHEVRRRAAGLEDAARFEFLANWLLPTKPDARLRVFGAFSPTDPEPFVDRFGNESIVSPVYDLLEVAAKTGQLETLRDRIRKLSVPPDPSQKRAHLALLVLVNLELGDTEAAARNVDALQTLVAESDNVSDDVMWPETLVVYQGTHRFQATPIIGDLLTWLYSQRAKTNTPPTTPFWHGHLTSLMAHYRYLVTDASPDRPDEPLRLDEWVAARRVSASSRGRGYPQVRWRQNAEGEVEHLSGHDDDYLLFRSPLRGNFEIEGDIGANASTQIAASGMFFGPRWTLDEFTTGTLRGGAKYHKLDSSFSHYDPWVRFRVVCQDGHRTVFLNGRQVHSAAFSEHHDPWFGIRSWGRSEARFRDVRISGQPRIPDALHLSADPELPGWMPYYGESIADERAAIRHVEDPDYHGQIWGVRRGALQGSHFERLLRYYRPLSEDCVLSYDFYYKPGQTETHPALDREAFVLRPDGVYLHWLTDGRYETTELAPANETLISSAGQQLPLVADAWNHLELQLKGDLLTLRLNEQLVLSRTLEPTNDRCFGLFHDAAETHSRVRDVTWRGDWPKQLASPAEQELADPLVHQLDVDLARLTSVFRHDFTQSGLDDAYFVVESDGREQLSADADGLKLVRPGLGGWGSSSIKLRFTALGDFDVETEIAQFDPKTSDHDIIALSASLDNEAQHQCRVTRGADPERRQQLSAALIALQPDGSLSYDQLHNACETSGGRLRLARRGSTMHYLWAENDSPVYRVLRTEDVSASPTLINGIELKAFVNGVGGCSVIFKNVTVRAEHLKYSPPKPEYEMKQLYTMRADGTQLRRVMAPLEGYSQVGSPEFSPDGKLIALDMSTGTVSTSRIVVVDAEGKEPRDIGPGCMPSFSKDSRQLVFSQPGQGVMKMNADGSARTDVDGQGWGVQWSPDGEYLAYGRRGNIVLLNVETEESRNLIGGADADRYSYIFWNLGWSHDGRSIAFKARNRQTGKEEIAVVDVNPPSRLTVLHSDAQGVHADFAWSPDNRQVLFAMEHASHEGPRLYQLDRRAPGQPQLFQNQPDDYKIYGAAWSADGRFLTLAATPPAQLVDWPVTAGDRR